MDRRYTFRFLSDFGGFTPPIDRAERAIQRFGRTTLSTVGRSSEALTRLGNTLGGQLTAIASTGGVMMLGREYIEFSAALARLEIQSGRTGKGLAGLDKDFFRVGRSVGQLPDQMRLGVDAIIERTGKFDFARKVAKTMGIVATATSSAMEDIGAMSSNLEDKMGITEDKMLSVFDILHAQGKEGAFTLQHQAKMMERLIAAAVRFDVKGVEGMRTFGAWMQLAKKGTGSVEQATTAIESSIADMLDPRKRRTIYDATGGFDIVDVEKSKAAGRTVMKDLDIVLKGIIEGTKGDESKLGQIFGRESIRGITRLAGVYRETGGFGEFEHLKTVGGDGKTVMADWSRMMDEPLIKFRQLKSLSMEFAHTRLDGPVEKLTQALTFLMNHPALAEGGLYGLLGLGGLVIAGAAVGSIKNIVDVLVPRGAKGAGLPGMGRAGWPDIQKVYVMNKHLSMLPGAGGFGGFGAPGTAGELGAAAPVMGRLGSVLLTVGRAAGVFAAAVGTFAAVYTAADTINNVIAEWMGYKVKGKHGVMGDWGVALYEDHPEFFDSMYGVRYNKLSFRPMELAPLDLKAAAPASLGYAPYAPDYIRRTLPAERADKPQPQASAPRDLKAADSKGFAEAPYASDYIRRDLWPKVTALRQLKAGDEKYYADAPYKPDYIRRLLAAGRTVKDQAPAPAVPNIKNIINLRVTIDENGKLRSSETDDLGTGINIERGMH